QAQSLQRYQNRCLSIQCKPQPRLVYRLALRLVRSSLGFLPLQSSHKLIQDQGMPIESSQ
ncbi:hypothetical protein D030_2020B, partial [Vibrio parahaemolyticus AQ3810]